MKKIIFFAGILLPALSFSAPKVPYSPPEKEVIAALSEHSRIPQKDLQETLKDCDASQTSINFCAYRDAVKQDLILKHVMAEWEKSRDDGCEKSSTKEYGDGSMRQAALATCIEFSTKKMTDAVQQFINKK